MSPTRRIDLPDRTLALEVSAPAPEVGVLLLHGYGASRSGTKVRHLAQALMRRGAPWAALDFTAHGDSGGSALDLSIARLVDDVAGAVAHLREREGWSGRLVLAGSSMGGVATAWAASERLPETAGLFLVAPAMRLVERLLGSLAPEEVFDWERTGRLARVHRGWAHELGWGLVADWRGRDHDGLARRLTMPIALVQGALDAAVPLSDVQAFARNAPDLRLVVVEGGDHRLHEHLPLLERELAALLERVS